MRTEHAGWAITRPGYKDEPARVATWYVSPTRSEAIGRMVAIYPDPKAAWKKYARDGWKCEKVRIVVTLA